MARINIYRTTVLSALFIALCGCQTPPADTEATKPKAEAAMIKLQALPVDTAWALTSAKASGLEQPEATAIRLAVSFSRLSGNSGCNNFSAGYQMIGDTLSVGQAAATKRGCPPPVGDIERALFALLPTLTFASMDGTDLLLHGANGAVLRFAPDNATREGDAGDQ